MMDEYKKNQQSENPSALEYQASKENIVIKENPRIDEYKTVSENTNEEVKYAKKNSKRNKSISALSGGLVSIIGVAVIGMTELINVSMNAAFNECVLEDNNIIYEVSVSNMTNKEELHAYLYYDNKLVEKVPLVDLDNDGVINGVIELDSSTIDEELQLNDNVSIRYNLKLKGNVGLNVEREFDSYVIKIDKITSEFKNVSGECHCGIDGTYQFKMNFSDAYGIFSDFNAYIEDSYGNKSYCDFTDNLHDEQFINVSSLKGSKVKFVLSYNVLDEGTRVVEEDITL